MGLGVAALGGCGAGKASGGSCRKGAKMAAMVQALTMGASEIYKKVSSKYNKTGEPHLLQEGISDVGKQLNPKELAKVRNGTMKAPLASDQSSFMKSAGKGPYMDAFAEFHDGLHDLSFMPKDQFSLIATMLPSYAVTVAAAMQPYSYYYYLDFIENRERR